MIWQLLDEVEIVVRIIFSEILVATENLSLSCPSHRRSIYHLRIQRHEQQLVDSASICRVNYGRIFRIFYQHQHIAGQREVPQVCRLNIVSKFVHLTHDCRYFPQRRVGVIGNGTLI
jgi:hypothetical protein